MAFLMAISWLSLLRFAALVLVIALFVLTLAGHFPTKQQSPEFKSVLGRLVLVASVLAIALSAAKAVGLVQGHVPVPVAVIGGGAALLAAPLVLQRFSDAFIDGKKGLATLAAVAVLLAYLPQ